MNSFCRPIHCGINHETPFFVEGNATEESEGKLSLRMRSITESLPEARLLRLLRRQRFQEAEQLARDFKLSMEDLHKVSTLAVTVNSSLSIEEF